MTASEGAMRRERERRRERKAVLGRMVTAAGGEQVRVLFEAY